MRRRSPCYLFAVRWKIGSFSKVVPAVRTVRRKLYSFTIPVPSVNSPLTQAATPCPRSFNILFRLATPSVGDRIAPERRLGVTANPQQSVTGGFYEPETCVSIPAAVLLLGMVIPDRSQNTLMVPNMAYCTPQMDAASILLGETHGDVLTSTLVISKTLADPPKTVWTHHGSFYPPGTKLCSLQPSPTRNLLLAEYDQSVEVRRGVGMGSGPD